MIYILSVKYKCFSLLVNHMETLAVLLLQTLCLDRFNDFVTGSNAVAPVRETASQALSLLMLKSTSVLSNLTNNVFSHLKCLLNMKSSEVKYFLICNIFNCIILKI